jgi:hypothetical protein
MKLSLKPYLENFTMIKFLEGLAVVVAALMIAVSTYFAFATKANSADCITTSQIEQNYENFKAQNPDNNHVKYYRFVGEQLEVVKEYVNSNYGAGLDESVKGLVITYLDQNPTGIVVTFPDDTINSCSTKVITPSVQSIELLINFLEGV